MLRPEEIEQEAVKHHSFFGAIMDAAGVWGPLTLAIVAVGVIANVVVLLRLQARRVNAPQLANMLTKLIAAGNVERAIKLCKATPEAVTTQMALAGLEARERNQDPRRAMSEVRPSLLREGRMGIVPAVALGGAALVECLVAMVAAQAKGFPENEVAAIAILPAVVGLLVVVNAMRWSGTARDLDTVMRAVW